jgi:hypothetical protein
MPDLGEILRAAPIGLLMLVGSYFAARRRKSAFAQAKERFPELARSLGLEFLKPADPARIGCLRGRFDGHSVFVDPDERPRIVVYFERAPRLVLRTYEHEKRTPEGMRRFDSGAPLVDRFFKERFAADDVVLRLRGEAPALEAQIRPFAADFRAMVAHSSVTPERFECAIESGRPNHIPLDVVKALLPAAVLLARRLEDAGAPLVSAAAS